MASSFYGLLCFVVVILSVLIGSIWSINPYPSEEFQWQRGKCMMLWFPRKGDHKTERNSIRNRKFQDYVFVKRECWSTLWKIRHSLRHENQVNEKKVHVLSYCDALRYMWNNNKNNTKLFSIMSNLQTHYLFKLDFKKSGPTYRNQAFNPRYPTS